MCAKKVNAETIFSKAQNLTGFGKMWIVNEAASQASNLPKGFLSVHLKQNAVSALRDALIVLKNGVKILEKFNGTILPPAQCSNTSISNEWTNTVGTMFYRHLISSTIFGAKNQIKFNSKGDRISIAYEILNRQFEKFLVVGFCNDEGDLFLEETAIIWPGSTKIKPLEITLPKHLRAVTVAGDAPFVYIFEVDDPHKCSTFNIIPIDDVYVPGPWLPCPIHRHGSTTIYCCAGYAIDLLSNLSISEPGATIDTGFTFELHLNTSYGIVQLGENGYTLNGLIGELDADLADIAVGALTINSEREQYIDFSEPWLYHGIRILEKWVRKPKDSPMQSFMQPLKPSLWYTLLTAVVLVGLTIYVLDLKSPFDRFYHARNVQIDPDDPFWEKTEDDRVTFGEAMWFVWGVLLNSGVCEKTPRSFSARILGLVWCGFVMITTASYTANLAAFLVLETPEKSLTGVNDPRLRNPSTNFSYATVLDTNTYQYFKRHVELSTMFRKMEGHNVRDPKEAIDALLNGTLGAFIWDSTRLDFEAMKNCELRTRGALFGRSAYGIGLQKHSPWTPHITNAILRLSENGMMEALDAKWINGAGKKPCIYEKHKSPARLALANMRDIFVLVAGGILLGAIFCVMEVKIGNKKRRDLKRNQLARSYANMWARKTLRRKRSALLSPPLVPRKYSEIVVRANNKDHTNNSKLGFHRNSDPRLSSKAKPHRIRPDHNFTTKSVKCYCSRCRNAVDTLPRPVVGRFTYISVAFCILTFLWPCAPLPCFLTAFADYVHYCPECGHIIGRFRRGGSPKFYV
uniref:LITAF domain-containing protein n=1 Tax=Panagrolaimus sp. PS1159 TaxID=55785 RepID=A0AC35FNM1_9BILA